MPSKNQKLAPFLVLATAVLRRNRRASGQKHSLVSHRPQLNAD